MAVTLIVDTCVWLDLAKDHREEPTIRAIEYLIKANKLKVIVPDVVITEFARNRERVAAETRRSIQSHTRAVKGAVSRFADEAMKKAATEILDEVDHRIALNRDTVTESMDRIEHLFETSPRLKASAAIKRAAAERAIAGLAPFHRDRNGMADALLIEGYASLLSKDKRGQFAFVSHNFKDFSEANGDRRKPHRDLSPLFNKRSTYWVSITDFLRHIEPAVLDDEDDDFNLGMETRRLSEILEAEYVLFRQVWYNRHWSLRAAVEDGRTRVVPDESLSRNPYRPDEEVAESIWKGALAAAKRTEDEIGADKLGPWDDFEWGMINGKLSALRWITGDDWDMLDT